MEKTGGGGGGRGGIIWEESSKEVKSRRLHIDGQPSERPQEAAWTDDVAMNLDNSEGVGKVPRRSRVVKEPSPLGLTLRKTPSLLDFISYRLHGGKNGLHGGKNGLSGGSCSASSAADGGVKMLGRGKSTKQGSASSGVSSLQTADNKLKASNFPASSLKIGKWERVSRYEGDLVSKCYYAKRKLVWEVLDNGLKSKIEIQWSDICGLKASCPEDLIGMLEIEVSRAPLFFCETNPQPRKHTLWQATTDFTGGQATISRHHSLTFPEGVLTKHYEKLLQCDPRLKSLVQGIDIVGLRGVHCLLGGVTSTYQGQHSVHESQEPERQRQRHSAPKLMDARHEDNKGKGSNADIDVLVMCSGTLSENTVLMVPPLGAQSSVENPSATLQPSTLGNYASSTVTVEQQQRPPSDSWKGEFDVRQRHQQQSPSLDSWKGEFEMQKTDGMVVQTLQRMTTRVLVKSDGWDHGEGYGELEESASAKLDSLQMGNKGWERETSLMEQESPCATAERETGDAMLIPSDQPATATSNFKQSITMTDVHQITSAIERRPNVLDNHDHVYGGLDQLHAPHLQTRHSLEQGHSNSEADESYQPEDPMLDAVEVKNPFAEEGSRCRNDACIGDAQMVETPIAPLHDGPRQQFNHPPSPPSSLPGCSSGSFSSNPPPFHHQIGSQQLVLGAETTTFLGPHPCDMFVSRQHASIYRLPSPQVFCTPLFRGGGLSLSDCNHNSPPVLPVQPHLSQTPHVADMEVMDRHHDITINSVNSVKSVKSFMSDQNVQSLQSHASTLPGHASSSTVQSLQSHASIETSCMSGCRILPVTSMSGELKQAMEHGPLSEDSRLGGMVDMASSRWKRTLTEGSSAVMGSVRGSVLGRIPDAAPASLPVSVRNTIPGSLLGSIPGSIPCSLPGTGLGFGSVSCSIPGSVLGPVSHSVLQSVPVSVPPALSASLWETHSLQRQVPPTNDTATHLTNINNMFDFLHSSETMTESATMDSILEEEDSVAAIGELIADDDDNDNEDDEAIDSVSRIPSSDVLLHNVPRVASMPQFFIRDKESGALLRSQRETHALTARS